MLSINQHNYNSIQKLTLEFVWQSIMALMLKKETSTVNKIFMLSVKQHRMLYVEQHGKITKQQSKMSNLTTQLTFHSAVDAGMFMAVHNGLGARKGDSNS